MLVAFVVVVIVVVEEPLVVVVPVVVHGAARCSDVVPSGRSGGDNGTSS